MTGKHVRPRSRLMAPSSTVDPGKGLHPGLVPSSSLPVHGIGLVVFGAALLAFHGNGTLGLTPLTGYLSYTFIAALGTLLLALRSQRGGTLPLAALLIWALLFRALAVSAPPLMEDDVYRYLWDGWVTLDRGSPYGVTPATYFHEDALPAVWEQILGQVAYPEIPTAYGPAAQWLFAALATVLPGALWPLQLLALLADLAVLALVLRLVPMPRRGLAVLLYGWCPLVVKEFANSAHIDIIGVFLLILALVATGRGRQALGGVCLALAIGIKPFAILAAPGVLLRREGSTQWPRPSRWPRPCWGGIAGLVLTLLLVSVPLDLAAALAPEGLGAMATTWVFNAPLHEWLLQSAGPVGRARVALLLLLAAALVMAWLWLRPQNDLSAARAPWASWPLLPCFALL
ncbi:MAG: hypothetical protein AAGI15_17715, partial [Pseudomonadota bacterium]